MALRNYSNVAPPVQLTSNVTNVATSLPVTSTSGYPTAPFLLAAERGTVNEEVMLCTAIADGTHFTVTRGYDGTTAVAHNSPAAIEHATAAIDVREPNTFINTVTSVGDLLLGSGQGTVTRLASGATGTVLTGAGVGVNPTWSALTKTLRIPHTFSISGLLAVPSGATNYIPGFYVPVPSGQTATVIAVRASVRGGTSATVALQKNGSASITALTAISVTTTATTTTATGGNTLVADDYLAPVISAISGTPDGLSFTVYIDYTA